MGQEEFERLIATINGDGQPWETRGEAGLIMSVHEMGDLLGLKKTERYWLIHKKYFPTILIGGRMYVKKTDFELWYQNQDKYHKVTGEKPGEALKLYSYSTADIAELLDISSTTVQKIIHDNHLDMIEYQFQRRVLRKSFEEWYKGQSRYRVYADRKRDTESEWESFSVSEAGRLIGVTYPKMYQIMRSAKYGHFFEFTCIADRKRITRASFEAFLRGQDEYSMVKKTYVLGIDKESNKKLELHRRKVLDKNGPTANIGTDTLYTRQEAALLAGVSVKTIDSWSEKGYFNVVRIGKIVRINRETFDEWMIKKERSR